MEIESPAIEALKQVIRIEFRDERRHLYLLFPSEHPEFNERVQNWKIAHRIALRSFIKAIRVLRNVAEQEARIKKVKNCPHNNLSLSGNRGEYADCLDCGSPVY